MPLFSRKSKAQKLLDIKDSVSLNQFIKKHKSNLFKIVTELSLKNKSHNALYVLSDDINKLKVIFLAFSQQERIDALKQTCLIELVKDDSQKNEYNTCRPLLSILLNEKKASDYEQIISLIEDENLQVNLLLKYKKDEESYIYALCNTDPIKGIYMLHQFKNTNLLALLNDGFYLKQDDNFAKKESCAMLSFVNKNHALDDIIENLTSEELCALLLTPFSPDKDLFNEIINNETQLDCVLKKLSPMHRDKLFDINSINRLKKIKNPDSFAILLQTFSHDFIDKILFSEPYENCAFIHFLSEYQQHKATELGDCYFSILENTLNHYQNDHENPNVFYGYISEEENSKNLLQYKKTNKKELFIAKTKEGTSTIFQNEMIYNDEKLALLFLAWCPKYLLLDNLTKLIVPENVDDNGHTVTGVEAISRHLIEKKSLASLGLRHPQFLKACFDLLPSYEHQAFIFHILHGLSPEMKNVNADAFSLIKEKLTNALLPLPYNHSPQMDFFSRLLFWQKKPSHHENMLKMSDINEIKTAESFDEIKCILHDDNLTRKRANTI